MKITYKINKKEKIITETWPEKLTIEDYKDVKKREFSDPDFCADFHVITDTRKVDMKFDPHIIDEIISFMKENSDKMRNRKSAIVADSPQNVAKSLFFGHRGNDLPVKISVFSSMEAARKWILENW